MDDASREFLELQEALAGRYSLDRELGRGGMGVVYLAQEVALDRPVALKVLPTEMAAEPRLRERFLREARTAARLSHPHIVPIFSVDEVGRFVFFAMAHIDGETLGDRVRERGPLSHAEATRMLREVAWALAYAHAQGVVHRDVKPDNILLENGSGRALVMDFGIALAGREAYEDGPEVIGTAEFMSPEQATGREVDARSDIYSLGAVGYYAVSGRLPFEGESASVVLARHVTRPAPPVASVAPDLPSRLAGPIDRCLRKDPAERWEGGEALAASLQDAGFAERPLPVPLRVFIKRLREVAQGIPGVAVVLLFLLGPLMGRLVFEGAVGTTAAIVGALLAAAALTPAALLGYNARKLLKAGYRVEDVRHALERDVERRDEELAFEYGAGNTWYDQFLKVVAGGSWAIALVTLVAAVVVGGEEAMITLVLSAGIGAISSLLALGRAGRRRDLVGAGWSRLLGTRAGDALFDASGFLLRRPAAAGSATYRPTELSIGMAADRLFEDLPKDVRRTLRGLPETLRKLEADAQAMRKQVAELDAVLAEIGDDPDRVGADERARLRAGVEDTRDEARDRLTKAVSALETIRLGLLRMHAGDDTLASVTAELEAARGISGDIEGLLEGRAEVERLLGERRGATARRSSGSGTGRPGSGRSEG